MRTIIVSDTIAEWIDAVKKDTGRIGVDHGRDVMCEDADAIMYMYVSWQRLKHVEEALGYRR